MTTESAKNLIKPSAPVVDYQVHWYPPAVVEQLVGRSAHPTVERAPNGDYTMWLDDGVSMPIMDRLTVDLDGHLEHAAARGVDVLVVGPACLAEVLHLPAAEAGELLRRVHIAYAEAQREHPEHIVGLAALPMQDPSLALDMLEHAIGELDLRGVSLMTTVDEKRPLVTEESLPVFARIAELAVPLVMHPGFRSATRFAVRTIREDAGLSWTFQTSLAALRLIDEGVLDAVPDLVVVHPHLGGVLPYIAERIELLGGSKAKHRIEHYFKKNFYVDTAAGNPGALRLAIEAYGIDRILFASDFPFYDMAEVRKQVEDAVGGEAAQRIYANRVPGLRLPAPAVSA
jgi:predicted TIM-barrel fold metal-dependent hydrolase